MQHSSKQNLLKSHAAETAAFLSLLANKKRLLILYNLMAASELSVGDLAKALNLNQSALSQHLAKLRAECVLTTRGAMVAPFSIVLLATAKAKMRLICSSRYSRNQCVEIVRLETGTAIPVTHPARHQRSMLKTPASDDPTLESRAQPEQILPLNEVISGGKVSANLRDIIIRALDAFSSAQMRFLETAEISRGKCQILGLCPLWPQFVSSCFRKSRSQKYFLQ